MSRKSERQLSLFEGAGESSVERKKLIKINNAAKLEDLVEEVKLNKAIRIEDLVERIKLNEAVERKEIVGRKKIPSSVMSRLYIQCGGECAFEGCDQKLAPPSSEGHIAEAAHISALSPGGPRYDPNMSDEERNDIDNLILLCPNHHKEIDKGNPDKYTVEILRKMKQEHERRVQDALYSRVAFQELEIVTEYIIESCDNENLDDVLNDFDKVKLSEKININNLTESNRCMIESALQKASVVREFIARRAQLEPRFPKKLRAGFQKHYFHLVENDYEGGDLFNGMCSFVRRPFVDDFTKAYTALSVLAYLFDACNVFEREK